MGRRGRRDRAWRGEAFFWTPTAPSPLSVPGLFLALARTSPHGGPGRQGLGDSLLALPHLVHFSVLQQLWETLRRLPRLDQVLPASTPTVPCAPSSLAHSPCVAFVGPESGSPVTRPVARGRLSCDLTPLGAGPPGAARERERGPGGRGAHLGLPACTRPGPPPAR